MTKKEFQELKEHMDRRFDSIDRRLDSHDQRFDSHDQRFDSHDRRFDSMADEYRQLIEFIAPRFDDLGHRLTAVEVLGEKNQHQIEIVAEKVTALDRKLEDFRGEVKEEFKEVRGEMAVGFEAVRSEMAEGFDAQGKLIRGLGGRVERLEARRA